MNPTLIDSHCHLDFEVFDEDRAEVLQRATKNGIQKIIIPGTEKKHWSRIKTLCNQHKQCHPCYGLHPYWVEQHNKSDIESLSHYIENNRTVAVGECGLDFREHQADKNTQQYYFEAQLSVAENFHLPVVIHSVKATETIIKTLKKFKNITGMIHSYSGSTEQAKQLIDLGFLISVGGSATYDNAKKIRSVIKNIPLTSLIIETDAPDQSDNQNKGTRNEPSFLVNTVKTISEIRQEEQTVIAQAATDNTCRLFSITLN